MDLKDKRIRGYGLDCPALVCVLMAGSYAPPDFIKVRTFLTD